MESISFEKENQRRYIFISARTHSTQYTCLRPYNELWTTIFELDPLILIPQRSACQHIKIKNYACIFAWFFMFFFLHWINLHTCNTHMCTYVACMWQRENSFGNKCTHMAWHIFAGLNFCSLYGENEMVRLKSKRKKKVRRSS